MKRVKATLHNPTEGTISTHPTHGSIEIPPGESRELDIDNKELKRLLRAGCTEGSGATEEPDFGKDPGPPKITPRRRRRGRPPKVDKAD